MLRAKITGEATFPDILDNHHYIIKGQVTADRLEEIDTFMKVWRKKYGEDKVTYIAGAPCGTAFIESPDWMFVRIGLNRMIQALNDVGVYEIMEV